MVYIYVSNIKKYNSDLTTTTVSVRQLGNDVYNMKYFFLFSITSKCTPPRFNNMIEILSLLNITNNIIKYFNFC